jgi:hypothetical protein
MSGKIGDFANKDPRRVSCPDSFRVNALELSFIVLGRITARRGLFENQSLHA